MHPNLLNRPLLATAQQVEAALYPAQKALNSKSNLVNQNVAVIPVEGLLLQRFEGFGSSYEAIRYQLKQALENPAIEQIVLDIDSGGGEVNGLFDLVDFIFEARKEKPIIALVNEQAYSAAYLIASAATQIIAPRTGGVGSIGVMVAHLDQSDAEKQIGLKYTEIFSGKHKVDFSPHKPLSETAAAQLQTQVDETYKLLIQTLVRNRNQPESVFESTEAQTYLSNQALELNLVDKIQPIYQLIEEISMKEEQIENPVNPMELLADERKRIQSIVDLCELAKMPECIGPFIKKETSAEEARTILLEKMAANVGEPNINAIKEQAGAQSQMMQAMIKGLQGV
ncbi:MAG: S49 family peptidase [Gammaproteobacteria bacterium]